MNSPSQKPSAERGGRLSRAALIAIALILVACAAIAAALIGAGKDEESVAPLKWEETKRIPDSLLIEIPNSFGHEMGILDPELRATAADSEGESHFAATATLWMDAGSPLEGARARCSIKARKGAEVAAVDLDGLTGARSAAEEGIEFERPPGKPDEQRFEWTFPPEPSGEELELGFGGVWKTTSVPAVKIACSLTTRDGTVTRRTGGAMPSS